MKNKAIITANPTTNEVFTLNVDKQTGEPKLGKDGKRYGFIRVEQVSIDMSAAVLQPKVKSALRSISEDAFNAAKNFFATGMELPGNIVTKESMVKEQGYTAKRAGKEEDAPLCTVKGQPVYQTTVYTEDLNESDVLIAHDNTEEIKAFQASKLTSKVKTTKPAEALN